MKWLFPLGLVVVAGIGLWLVPQNRVDREGRDGAAGEVRRGATSPQEPTAGAVATSGVAHDGAAENARGDALTELETITGANDGMTLVGRRVDLHVDVQDLANDRAFWVGSRDNRVLVVLGRDNRTPADRQHGLPTRGHNISPVRGGQRAAISGVIRPVPRAEERFSWDLTKDEEHELADRKIYIRADTVSSEGHGRF